MPAADDGGPFDNFRDEDGWKTHWSSDDPTAWKVSDQVRTHSGKSYNTRTPNQGDGYATYALHVQVSQGTTATPAGGIFGVTIGSSLAAQWNAAESRRALLDGSGTRVDQVQTVDEKQPLLPCNVLVLATPKSAYVFVDQQLTLADVAPSGAAVLKVSAGLFTDAEGLGIAQVFIDNSDDFWGNHATGKIPEQW